MNFLEKNDSLASAIGTLILSACNTTLCSAKFRLTTLIVPWIGYHRSIAQRCEVLYADIYAYSTDVDRQWCRFVLERECAEPARHRTLDRACLDDCAFWQFSAQSYLDIAYLRQLKVTTREIETRVVELETVVPVPSFETWEANLTTFLAAAKEVLKRTVEFLDDVL